MAQTIITTAAVIAAAIAIVGYYNKVYSWVKHQEEQDKRMDRIEKAAATERKELTLIVYALSACLDGLGSSAQTTQYPSQKIS